MESSPLGQMPCLHYTNWGNSELQHSLPSPGCFTKLAKAESLPTRRFYSWDSKKPTEQLQGLCCRPDPKAGYPQLQLLLFCPWSLRGMRTADCQSEMRHLTHFCGCGFRCENKTKNPLESQGVGEKENKQNPRGWLVYKDLIFRRPLRKGKTLF